MSTTDQALTLTDRISQLKAADNAASVATLKLERDLLLRRRELQSAEKRLAERQWLVATGQAQQDDHADAQDAVLVSGLREQIRVGEQSFEEFKRRRFAAHEAMRTAIGDDLVEKAIAAETNAYQAVRSLFPLLESLQDGFRTIAGVMEERRQAFAAIDRFEPDTGKARVLATRARRKRMNPGDWVQTYDRQNKLKPEFAYLAEPENALALLAERVDDELIRLAAGGDLPQLLHRFVVYREQRDGSGLLPRPVEEVSLRQLINANEEFKERLVAED